MQHITEPSSLHRHHSFTATVASSGYHVYKKISWANAKVGEKVTVEMETKKYSLEVVDPYACAIKIKNCFFNSLITIGHIPREISRHVHAFIKTEGGKVIGHVKSLNYRPSPIPSGGLEIPLQPTFTCDDKLTLDLINGCVKSLYYWNCTGVVQDHNGEDDDEEESDSDDDFVINTKDNDEENDNANDDVIVLD